MSRKLDRGQKRDWRSQVSSPPLRWSNQLADVAQDWANNLASQGGNSISHRPNNRYGENIYWISGAQASPSQAVAVLAHQFLLRLVILLMLLRIHLSRILQYYVIAVLRPDQEYEEVPMEVDIKFIMIFAVDRK